MYIGKQARRGDHTEPERPSPSLARHRCASQEVDQEQRQQNRQRVGAGEARVEDMHRVDGERNRSQERGDGPHQPPRHRIADEERRDPRGDCRQPKAQDAGPEEVFARALEQGQRRVRSHRAEGADELPIAALDVVQGVVLVAEERQLRQPLQAQVDADTDGGDQEQRVKPGVCVTPHVCRMGGAMGVLRCAGGCPTAKLHPRQSAYKPSTARKCRAGAML